MAKAILIMDKQDNCAGCPIHKTTGLCIPGIDADLHEWFNRRELYLIETPDWCPLISAIGYVQPVGHVVSWEDEE